MKKNMLIYYWYEKKAGSTMFLSKILIHLCMTIHYIVGKNIFVVIYKLLVQRIYRNIILKIDLKVMVKKGLRCLRKMNMLNLKIMKGK